MTGEKTLMEKEQNKGEYLYRRKDCSKKFSTEN